MVWAGVFLTFFIWVSQAWADPTRLDELRRDLETLQQIYTRETTTASLEFTSAVTQIDHSLRQMLMTLFREKMSLNDIQVLTKGVIVWEEWPTDISMEKARGLADRRDPLCILYRTIATSRGWSVHCLANSFLARTYRNRVNPGVYTINVNGNGDTTLAVLPNMHADLTGVGAQAVFLGTVDYGFTVPSVLFLAGPHGSGQFIRCYAFVYSDQSKSWTSKMILERSPVFDYDYNERRQELAYKAYTAIKSPDHGQLVTQAFSWPVPKSFQSLTNKSGPFDK